MHSEVLDAPPARLGECPIWCERTQRLYWVDVLDAALWSHDPATGECTPHVIRGRRLGSIALRRHGGLILACDDGLHSYDPETGEQTFLVDPEPDRRGHRKNDGRADAYGNFWVGTLREDDYAPVGAIYRVTSDLACTTHWRDLAIPNGLAFDPHRRRLYFADTRAYRIWSCDYDGERVGVPVEFARTIAPARPDGSCLDREGNLWNAEYAGGRMVQFSPEGRVLAGIELPVSHPTCGCFGGKDLDRLYVTSALEPLTADQRLSEPLAGRVIVLDVGMQGRSEYLTGI